MRALLDVLLHPFARDEIKEGVRCVLRFAGACYLQAALVKFVQSQPSAWLLLGVAAVVLGLSAVRVYFILLLAITGWTVFLVLDFLLRANPFSVFFAVIGVFHIYKMLRWRTGRAGNIA